MKKFIILFFSIMVSFSAFSSVFDESYERSRDFSFHEARALHLIKKMSLSDIENYCQHRYDNSLKEIQKTKKLMSTLTKSYEVLQENADVYVQSHTGEAEGLKDGCDQLIGLIRYQES